MADPAIPVAQGPHTFDPGQLERRRLKIKVTGLGCSLVAGHPQFRTPVAVSLGGCHSRAALSCSARGEAIGAAEGHEPGPLSPAQVVPGHRVRQRWGPHVPHAETEEAPGGTRQVGPGQGRGRIDGAGMRTLLRRSAGARRKGREDTAVGSQVLWAALMSPGPAWEQWAPT